MRNNLSPNHTSPSKLRSFLIFKVVVSALIVLIALVSFEVLNKDRKGQKRVAEVTRQLSAYQARLETLVNNNLELTQAVAAYISLNPELSQQQYAQFARLLLAKDNQIKNIGAAREHIITYVYPLKGNEGMIGVNYLDIPQQKQAVEKALAVDSTVLAGPVQLLQGGIGLIARKPIWVNQTGELWGLAFVVLDYLSIVELSGVGHQQQLNIAIRGKDALGDKGEVFFGDGELFNRSPVVLNVTLPYGEWLIAAEPALGWPAIEIDLSVWLSAFLVLCLWSFLLALRANNQLLQHKSIESLMASEQKFRTIFANHNATMLMVEQNSGRIIDANQAAADFYGYSVEQLKQKQIQQINCLSAQEVAEKRRLAIETKQNNFIFPHQLADGTVRQVEVHSSPIQLSDGVLLFSIIHDVTDRVESEQRLKLDAKVFEYTKEGVLITNSQKEIISVNRAFSDITGYDELEVMGKDPKILSSGKYPPSFYSDMYQAIELRGFWRGEIWNRRKDGSLYPELLSISKLENERGELTHYVAVFSDISKLKQSEKQLKDLAHYDVLTHLPNRLLLMTRIEHAIERVKRHQSEKLGVLFLDLDQFKIVNDSLGHVVGDELLCQVAKRLTNRIRQEDTVARLGGDEFIILIEGFQQVSDLVTIARDLIQELNRPFALSVSEAHIGTSIGIAIYPDDTQDAEKILSYADAAMYKAKENGRNTYAFYTESITKQAEHKLKVTNQLKAAIEFDFLELYYQPQINLHDGKITGAEALLRWNHPEGVITPDKFIPLAEEKGLIHQLTLWVIKQGCEQLKGWQQEGKELVLSVNVSAKDWECRDFVGSVEQILQDTGVDARYLEFELTENSIMNKGEQVLRLLKQVKQLGISLALDDFGTGHSSLAYLKHFPVDKLKIDRSFIIDLEHTPSDKMIIATIVDMAKNFGLQVVAEGIELASQAEYLRLLDCDLGQGYYYSKPIPVDEFEQLLLQKPIFGEK